MGLAGAFILPAARRVMPSVPKEHPISRVTGLVDAVVAQAIEEGAKFSLVRWRHLHSDQHPPIVGAMVAVVKRADVPSAAHVVQKLHQCAGALGELETIQNLI